MAMTNHVVPSCIRKHRLGFSEESLVEDRGHNTMILDHLAFAVIRQELNAHRRGIPLVVVERPPTVAYQHVGEGEVGLRYGDVLHVYGM